jgi:hypothetical protein
MDLKKDKTIGAAALLAITAAVVGVSIQTGTKPAENSNQAAATLIRTKASTAAERRPEEKPGCGSVRDQFKNFLGLSDSDFLNPQTKAQSVLWETAPLPGRICRYLRRLPD